MQVKIGHFGFTKRLAGDKASLKVARITHPRWVAPEVRMLQDIGRVAVRFVLTAVIAVCH